MRSENKELFAEIRNIINYTRDPTALWYKVNWAIVRTSHMICGRRGAHGHKIRQKFRHTNWRLAQQFNPPLRVYSIPRELHGDTPPLYKGWIYIQFEKLFGKWRKGCER
jgi:hypothetical protein